MGPLVALVLTAATWMTATPAWAQATGAPAELAADVRPLDLNGASEAELLDLPGIGPSRARAIIAFREEHGGFRSVSELLRIQGFGRALFKRLRPLVRVSSPSP